MSQRPKTGLEAAQERMMKYSKEIGQSGVQNKPAPGRSSLGLYITRDIDVTKQKD